MIEVVSAPFRHPLWAELRSRLSRMTPARVNFWGVCWGLVFEAATLVMRLGMELRSAEATSWLAAWTFGWRIHHGYIGLLALILALSMRKNRALRNSLIVVGIALAISDAMHHSLALWIIEGSPTFDWRYALPHPHAPLPPE